MMPVVAQGHKCVTINAIDSGFDSYSTIHFVYFLIISFLRSGNEAKRAFVMECLYTEFLRKAKKNNNN